MKKERKPSSSITVKGRRFTFPLGEGERRRLEEIAQTLPDAELAKVERFMRLDAVAVDFALLDAIFGEIGNDPRFVNLLREVVESRRVAAAKAAVFDGDDKDEKAAAAVGESRHLNADWFGVGRGLLMDARRLDADAMRRTAKWLKVIETGLETAALAIDYALGVGDLEAIARTPGEMRSYLIVYLVEFRKAHGEYPTPDALREEAKSRVEKAGGTFVSSNFSGKTLGKNLFLSKFKAGHGGKRR